MASSTENNKARTLEEVGRLAGVSRNTVSLALANDPRVRPETRARVLQVVRETGYRRNSAAAALAGGLTHTLAVVEFGPPAYLSDRAYIHYLAGIEEATSSSGFDLLLLSARREPGSDSLVALAQARRFDGLVFLGAHTDRAAVAALIDAHVPVVHIGRRVIPQRELPYVTPDYVTAGCLAAERLLTRGAEHLIYITSVNQPESKTDFFEGAKSAIASAAAHHPTARLDVIDIPDFSLPPPSLGVTADVGLIVHGTRSGTALWRLLSNSGTPQVPLIVYDDEGWLTEALPALEWLRPQQRAIGQIAAHLAIALILQRGTPERHITVAPEASWLPGGPPPCRRY